MKNNKRIIFYLLLIGAVLCVFVIAPPAEEIQTSTDWRMISSPTGETYLFRQRMK